MIHNKSIHPVELKKISVRIWSLRDEIEAALERRIKECEAAGIPLYIEDIKKFYKLDKSQPTSGPTNVVALNSQEKPAEGQEAAPTSEENKNLIQAEEIIADQKNQGLDTQKPNPILNRPYIRQAPDLNKISYGFSFLADINMESALIFTKEKFLHGQSVVVEFLIPQPFMMSAEVSYCNHYGRTSRIISSTKPDYRLKSQFKFLIMGERNNLRNLLKSIAPTIPSPKKKVKKEVDLDSLEI
jgi:hypothetical protein